VTREENYQNHCNIKDIIRCILGLPLLPAADILTCLQEIRATICNDMQMARQLQQLVTYVIRQWIDTGNATTSTDSSDTFDRCEVCLIQPRASVAVHGTTWEFTFLCHLRRHCCVHGQWLPDMPNPHNGAWLCSAFTLNGRWQFCKYSSSGRWSIYFPVTVFWSCIFSRPV